MHKIARNTRGGGGGGGRGRRRRRKSATYHLVANEVSVAFDGCSAANLCHHLCVVLLFRGDVSEVGCPGSLDVFPQDVMAPSSSICGGVEGRCHE